MKVLANDGISSSGVNALEKAGFEVITTKVAQEQLIKFINEEKIDVLIGTKCHNSKKRIDRCLSKSKDHWSWWCWYGQY